MGHPSRGGQTPCAGTSCRFERGPGLFGKGYVLVGQVRLSPCRARGSFVAKLPEIHIRQLHERIVHSPDALDPGLLAAQLTPAVGAELDHPLYKPSIEARVLPARFPEAVDEEPIARGQAGKRAKE